MVVKFKLSIIYWLCELNLIAPTFLIRNRISNLKALICSHIYPCIILNTKYIKYTKWYLNIYTHVSKQFCMSQVKIKITWDKCIKIKKNWPKIILSLGESAHNKPYWENSQNNLYSAIVSTKCTIISNRVMLVMHFLPTISKYGLFWTESC